MVNFWLILNCSDKHTKKTNLFQKKEAYFSIRLSGLNSEVVYFLMNFDVEIPWAVSTFTV